MVGVHDGDTLTCLTTAKQQIKVRLAEIDTPESNQPYGNRAQQSLTLQYDKRLFVLHDTQQARALAGRYVEIYHYPDGQIEVRSEGAALPYGILDQLPEVNQGAIVDNKRLGHVLQVAQRMQEQRDSRRSQAVPGNPKPTKAQRQGPPKKKA